MNDAQLRTYGELAQAIAAHVSKQLETDDVRTKTDRPQLRDAPQPLFHHYFMSTFEAVAEDLRRLGILKDWGETVGLKWAYFVFDCEPSDAGAVARRNWQAGPSFDELLRTFLELFGDWGTEYWGFTIERDTPFGNGSRITPALDALSALGYLDKTSEGFVWTKRATEAMHSAGNWQDENAE
jgi:hypothetical protein